jgi:hypothetical protein
LCDGCFCRDRIFLRFTEDDKVIGVPNKGTLAADSTQVVIADAQGLLHTVKDNVGQQRTDDSALRGSGVGREKRSFLQVTRFQPTPNKLEPSMAICALNLPLKPLLLRASSEVINASGIGCPEEFS